MRSLVLKLPSRVPFGAMCIQAGFPRSMRGVSSFQFGHRIDPKPVLQARHMSGTVSDEFIPPAPNMDPFEVYETVKRLAQGGKSATAEKIGLNVDFSSPSHMSDLLLAFSCRGATHTGYRAPSWYCGERNCSICKKTQSWTELFKDLSEEDKASAMEELSRNTIPASALLKIASPAPFGKGDKTVIDTSVRKAFEIPADSIPDELFPKNAPPSWEITSQISSSMKPSNVVWKYQLYKMHIYEEGGKFRPHVDTLHADNHVATLVVGLPNEFKGGSLVVKHHDKEVSYYLWSGQGYMQWAALYTDCTHEVEEVTEGVRITLQYDIYEEKIDASAIEKDDEEEKNDFIFNYYFPPIRSNLKGDNDLDTFVQAVIADLRSKPTGQGVAFLMRHRYSLGSLDSNTLKGLDRLIFDAISASNDLEVALTGVVIHSTTDYNGRYKKNEVEANAVSMMDFDPNATAEFPCKTATLYLDNKGHEDYVLNNDMFIEHTGNEAALGSRAYWFGAFIIALAPPNKAK